MVTYANNFEGLWSIARHKIRDFSLENQRVAVGVSGGADSIGLFHVFSDFLKKNIISDLVVFHINFGLRGDESDGDERFVRELCEQKSVRCQVHRPAEPIRIAIQESARDFRLKIQNTFKESGFIVALAHNADDVCETVLMRLCRGSSAELAAGMSYFGDQIFRPWLDVSRETIRSALSEAHLPWREDSTNAATLYTRNRIRHDVMPILNELFPGASARVTRTFLTAFSEHADRNLIFGSSIPLSEMHRVAKTALDRSLHDWLSTQYGGRSPVPRQVIEKIAQAILAMSGGHNITRTFDLPHGKTLTLTPSEVTLYPRN